MSSIEERLDQVRDLVRDSDFLNGRGLSNEVNIRIFCYDPSDEMAVRQFVQQLLTDQSLPCRLIARNLYTIFLDLCDELEITDTVPEMQEQDGSEYLLEQIEAAIGHEAFVERIDYAPHQPGSDVLLITGVGEVFPFMRIHKLLDALQPHFTGIPMLVMYPGNYDGQFVRLFNLLPPNPYYRAFNVI